MEGQTTRNLRRNKQQVGLDILKIIYQFIEEKYCKLNRFKRENIVNFRI